MPVNTDLFGNPIVRNERLVVTDSTVCESPTVLKRQKRNAVREIRDLRRATGAAEAVAGFTRDMEIDGFTKGQFSLHDLVNSLVVITGPVHLHLSTWTANSAQIMGLENMRTSGEILSARWMIDASFARRRPQAANQLRMSFGLNSVRVTQTHSKFILMSNDTWAVVLRTSMNLNMNPRFENFTVAHDPELFAFTKKIMDELFSRQKKGITMAPGDRAENGRTFRKDL